MFNFFLLSVDDMLQDHSHEMKGILFFLSLTSKYLIATRGGGALSLKNYKHYREYRYPAEFVSNNEI